MPRENTSHNTKPKKVSPYSTPSRQPRKFYVGPLTQADKDLKDKSRTEAKRLNEERIHKALLLLVPKKVKNRPVCEHDLSWVEPTLCVGQNNPQNIGKWRVRVSRPLLCILTLYPDHVFHLVLQVQPRARTHILGSGAGRPQSYFGQPRTAEMFCNP